MHHHAYGGVMEQARFYIIEANLEYRDGRLWAFPAHDVGEVVNWLTRWGDGASTRDPAHFVSWAETAQPGDICRYEWCVIVCSKEATQTD